jgi:hypothetical protein
MAVAGSGVMGLTLKAGLNGGIVLDLDLLTHKAAMFTNSVTPNFDTDTAYAVSPYNANEVSGTGYTAGGFLLANTTFAIAASLLVWDNTVDPSWATSTISLARCALFYADALAGNNAICLLDFGSNFSTVADTFNLHLNTAGIIVFDYS